MSWGKYEVQIITSKTAPDAQAALSDVLHDIKRKPAFGAIVKNTQTGEVVAIDIVTREVFDRWTDTKVVEVTS